MRLREVWKTLRLTVESWIEDDASRLAAALAFYTLLSLAPLVIIAVALAGVWYGADAARGHVADELSRFVGRGAAEGIQAVVAAARSPRAGVIGTVAAGATLCFGASGMFSELRNALNTIWAVKPKAGRGLWGEVRDHLSAFAMVLVVALLLLGSLLASAALSAVGALFTESLPGGELVWQIVTFASSLVMVTVLFGLIFKYVADVEIDWRDVSFGAVVTALLFTVGKSLLGIYLGKASIGSAYGAAGSFAVLVVWVYYSAQILFLGAELTRVHAQARGRAIRPGAGAEAR